MSIHSLVYEQRAKLLADKCNSEDVHHSPLQDLIHPNSILDHFGFVLRSHSLFYCSVPKVATRTFLALITYLHINDDLTALRVSNFTNEQHNTRLMKDSALFNADHLRQILAPSTT
ncbi:unnamed protein product, partial [Rotaria sp. Silwood2]